ncbi:MAG: hypothetical protein ABWZ25_15880 [Chitinophagaceae bacterium]
MKSVNINYPPVEYVLAREEQPVDETWDVVNDFVVKWNAQYKNRFLKGEAGEWSLQLAGGIKDEEYSLAHEAMHGLKNKYGVQYFLGLTDRRSPADFEQADFIRVMGNTYPEGFVVNGSEIISSIRKCTVCGTPGRHNREVNGKLIIDYSYLDQDPGDDKEYAAPGIDLILIEGGFHLVSARLAGLLRLSARAFELIPVIDKDTGLESERLWLLRANRSILKPCNIHTPITGEGICAKCGSIRGALLAYYHVRTEWLQNDPLFSRQAQRYESIYFSNQLYHDLKNQQVRGMLATDGIYSCTHI